MEDTQAPNDTQNAEPITKSAVAIDPSRVRVLANGTLFDTDTKRFLPGGKPTTAIQPGKQASDMANRRHELAAANARKALALKAEEQGLAKSPIAAYGLLAGMAYDSSLANLMDKPREGVEAGKFALRLAHMLPEADKASVPTVAVQINIGPELVRAYGDED